MDMTRFEQRVAQMREKAGFEHLGKHECSDCGREYDLFKRKNTEESPIYNCPHCAVEAEDMQFGFDAIRNRNQELQRDADRTINSIPLDIKNKTFDDYDPRTDLQREAKRISVAYADNNLPEASLVFQGDTGIGKSHLTRCIVREFDKREQPYVFIDVPGLMNRIKSSFGKSDAGTYQDKLMRIIRNVDLLVLDDIGAEYVKPDANGHESWAADIIFQIVNSRLGKQNIYTTNYTSKDLKRKYGMLSSRIISRMMNKAKVIKVDGDDHRLKGFE